MTTTAEDPITEQPLSDPIDVELQASPVPPARTTRPARPVRRANSRRTRVTVRRFGLFSVFKFALIFCFCAMVVVWLALLLIYFMLSAAGVTDTVAYWINASWRCSPPNFSSQRVLTPNSWQSRTTSGWYCAKTRPSAGARGGLRGGDTPKCGASLLI